MTHATSLLPRAGSVTTCLLLLASTPAGPPASTLHVEQDGTLIEWWRGDAAPDRWTRPHTAVVRAFQWQEVQPGLRLAEATIVVNGGWLRLRVSVVALDPRQLRLRLIHQTADGITGTWSVAAAPTAAAFAVNAGQFSEAGPWGWVVRDGREYAAPGHGPLAVAIAVDSGSIRWIEGDAVRRAREHGRPSAAFQSYPMLLRADGSIPAALRHGDLIDRTHRDTRLAMGLHPDGRVVFVITRFAGAGRHFSRLPVGLTTPETAALLGALGVRPAVMLDGGLSAQMLVRDSLGTTRRWPGGRRVPLGLIAERSH